MSPQRPETMILPDAETASRRVAEIFAESIRDQPDIVLGLATGGTPVGAYRELIRMHQDAELDFSRVTTFNLDEYVGLEPAHPQSYRAFMQHHLFDHINIDPARTHVPSGTASDLAAHAAEYERAIRDAGGIELQLLGIGHNGHIAFNEPGTPADSRTRMIELTNSTILSNSRFFDSPEEVPRQAITMGIGTILEARQIVLLATGEGKAEAVQRAVAGEIDVNHPASLLQHHRRVTFVLDEAAAGALSR